MKMSHVLPGAAALLCLTVAAQGQNILKNGDFEAGMTSWTGTGPGGSPGVVAFDVNGLGSSQCFSLRPGGNTYAPPHAPYILSQQVLAVPTWYELRMDVHVSASNANAQGGIIDVKLGGNTVGTWQRFVASISVGQYRDQLCFRFKSSVVGPQNLDIEIGRPRYIWSTSTPLFYIDNVSLQLVSGPSVCMPGERKAGSSVALRIEGDANSVWVLLLALGLAPAPIPIPGINGSLELHPATLFVLGSGPLNANGVFQGNMAVPASVANVKFYWQALQANAQGLGLGRGALISFY